MLDLVRPISQERDGEGINQGGTLQTRLRPLRDRLHELRTDGVAQDIAQHGEQMLHLELELKVERIRTIRTNGSTVTELVASSAALSRCA